MTLAAGQVIEGKYRIVRVLGVGGMGSVYEGENVRIHRKVAIKILHDNVSSKADIVQRFEREAQAAGRIGSQHIVEVLDLGNLPGGERFMVMEYLDGEPLTNRIKVRGRVSAQELAPLLRQLLEGLAAAHAAGIVHRDLKPDNVFIVKRGGQDFVKILDFGVSKFSGADPEFSMTRTGAVMGTPFYMSPEQARGQPIDHRSDLYSIGVVAYQSVTGRVPYNAETFNELIFKIALENADPVETVVPGFDPGFSAIIRKAMAREPNHRFQTAGEFAAAVDSWRSGAPMQANYLPQPIPAYAGQAGAVGAGAFDPGRPGSAHALGTSGLGMSGGNLGVSGSLGQSGGNPAFGHSGAGLSQSGAGLSQSGGHAPVLMGQSQVGLAVTTREPKRTPLVAAVAVMAVLGVGGGLAAYKYAGIGASAAATPPAQQPAAPGDTTATTTAEPTPADTSASPTAEPTAEPTAQVSAEPSAEPSADVAPTDTSKPAVAARPGRPGRPQPPTPPKPTAAANQPPPSSGAGRNIGTDL